MADTSSLKVDVEDVSEVAEDGDVSLAEVSVVVVVASDDVAAVVAAVVSFQQ